jgi:hypothetical protein
MSPEDYALWRRKMRAIGVVRSVSTEAVEVPPKKTELVAVEAKPVKLVFRKQCQAVDLSSGSRCKLLDGHVGPHGCERGQFIYTLGQGMQPAREQHLVAAEARRTSAMEGL